MKKSATATMETLNIVKGYGKLNLTENLEDPKPLERRRRRWLILAVVVTVLVLVSLIAALAFNSATKIQRKSEPLTTVCAVTRYPESCFSSMAPLNDPPARSPLSFFKLSLHVGILQISSLKKLTSTPTSESAMQDCVELLDDAAGNLGKSAELVAGGEKMPTDTEISDLKTWISAAMTDQDTCVDGLAEMKSTALSDFKTRVQTSQEYLSNTLAILGNIQILSNKLIP